MNTTVLLGLLSAVLFGLRHGIDYDHIAAITDITSVESDRKRALRLGMTYALGHGLVVLMLGALAVEFGQLLPASVDLWMERFVGTTLILLGAYVIWSLVTATENSSPVSRFAMMARLMARLRHKEVTHRVSYDSRGAFFVGMVHGVGAETPTQLGLFLFAAGVGGKMIGFLGVCLFVAGLMITNFVMCLASVRLFRTNARSRLYRGLAGVAAAYSVGVGVLFLAGASGLLPSL